MLSLPFLICLPSGWVSLVMWLEFFLVECKHLVDMISGRVPWEQISKVIAMNYCLFPHELVPGGRLDIRQKVESKIFNDHPELPYSLQKSLFDSFEPVFDYFSSADLFWGRNGDFHPENILLYKGRIALVDFETSYLVPVQFDLANLLDYTDGVSEESRRLVLESCRSHIEHMADCSLDEAWFDIGCHNAVPVRMFGLSGAWGPDRPSMYAKRH